MVNMKKIVVDYDHSKNIHSTTGAEKGFNLIFSDYLPTPSSLIDIGCGAGFWLAAGAAHGVPKIQGVDGIQAKHLRGCLKSKKAHVTVSCQ
jgi:hypothetical protein